MDRCSTQFYVIGALIYAPIYYLMENSQSQFSWSRFIFLCALLVLLERYQLVPGPLLAPPRFIYPIYKVFTAIILSYLGTVLIFSQIEDFLQWLINFSASMFEYVPMVRRKLQYSSSQLAHSAATLLVSLYFLHWVLTSVNLLPKYELRVIRCPSPYTQCPECKRNYLPNTECKNKN